MNGNIEERRTSLRIRKRLGVLVYAAAVAVLVFLLATNFRDVAETLSAHIVEFLVATGIGMLQAILQARNFVTILAPPLPPSATASVRIWAITALANYLAPLQPGVPLRAVLFRSSGVSFVNVLAATGRQAVLMIWLSTLLATSFAMSIPGAPVRLLAAGALAIVVLSLVGRHTARTLLPGRPAESLGARMLGALLWTPSPAVMLNALMQFLLMALSLELVYSGFGASLGFNEGVVVSAATTLSGIAALTPNNLGIMEAILGYAGHLNGLKGDALIAIALLFRIAHIVANASLVLIIDASELIRRALQASDS